MDLKSWLSSISATNDPAKTPTKPFTVLLGPGQEPFTFATDCVIIAIVSWNPSLNLHATDELGAEETTFLRVVQRAQIVQEKAVRIGTIDALSLKELVGEAQWGPDAFKQVMWGYNKSVCIDGEYYSVSVLARALAAWTEPLANLYKSSVLDREGANALLLIGDTMAVICSPYLIEGMAPEDVITLPEWMVVRTK